MNRLGAFEVKKVHHINVVDTGFVPCAWCLKILRDAVLLKFQVNENERNSKKEQ